MNHKRIEHNLYDLRIEVLEKYLGHFFEELKTINSFEEITDNYKKLSDLAEVIGDNLSEIIKSYGFIKWNVDICKCCLQEIQCDYREEVEEIKNNLFDTFIEETKEKKNNEFLQKVKEIRMYMKISKIKKDFE